MTTEHVLARLALAESSQPPPARVRRRPEVSPQTLALLHRAQCGDRDAFGELYRAYRDPVTRYVSVRMRHRDPDAVPDLVHDAFCEALAHLCSALLDVRGWFIILAAKACIRHDWSRRRYVRAAYTVHEANRTTNTRDVASADRRPGRVTFVHAMARLTPDQRRAIQLRYLDGFPRDATGRLMNRSVEAVRCLERRAIRQMRQAFAGTSAHELGAAS